MLIEDSKIVSEKRDKTEIFNNRLIDIVKKYSGKKTCNSALYNN